MKYDGTLPINIDGHQHNTLVHQFQAWKGTEYIPEHMHPGIHWTKSNPFVLEETQDTEWHVPKYKGHSKQINDQSQPGTEFTVEKGSIPLYSTYNPGNGKKHKSDSTEDIMKKCKAHMDVDLPKKTCGSGPLVCMAGILIPFGN